MKSHLQYLAWFLAGSGIVADVWSPIAGGVSLFSAALLASVIVLSESNVGKALAPLQEEVQALVQVKAALVEQVTGLQERMAEIENKAHARGIL